MSDEQKTVLVLRTSDKDGTAYGGFKWPESGIVECPDWKENSECGNGLHGILWPEGNWSDIKEYDEAIWQVVKVLESDIVKIEGKVKFPRGEVVYSGEFAIAFNMIAKVWLDKLKNEKIEDSELNSSGGYARIGSSGDFARIGSSGDYARIGSSGGYARIGSSGGYARIGSSGGSAQIESSGENSVIACAGSVRKFKVGNNGCITVPWHDGMRTRFAVGYVGENLDADTWYSVDGKGEFVKL